MNAKVKFGLALLLVVGSAGSLGQEGAPAAPTPPAPAPQPPAAPPPADVFIPTEELQAEDQVTFPVDI